VRYCAKCILPENLPGISFDKDGVCNHCNTKDSVQNQLPPEVREKHRRSIEHLLSRKNKRSPWDIVVGLSGGKDSAILAKILKEQYGLRVLGFTCDMGFATSTALENIQRIKNVLKIDHILVSVRRDFIQKVFRYMLRNSKGPFSACYCRLCGSLYGNMSKKIASLFHIPLVAFGWTAEQDNPYFLVDRDRFHRDLWMPKELFWNVLDDYDRRWVWNLYSYQVYGFIPRSLRYQVAKYFPRKAFKFMIPKYPMVITPFKVWPYEPQQFLREVVEQGLIEEGKQMPQVTNCKLIALFQTLDYKILGFNPYRVEFAAEVRQGKYNRNFWHDFFKETEAQVEAGVYCREVVDEILEIAEVRYGDLDKIAKERKKGWKEIK
jgi:hypothetical protein